MNKRQPPSLGAFYWLNGHYRHADLITSHVNLKLKVTIAKSTLT